MKKLALMSVALGAVSVYGAGEASATVTFLSSAASLPSNDSAAWPTSTSPLSLVTSTTAGTYTTGTSMVTSKGVTVSSNLSALLGLVSTLDLDVGTEFGTPNQVRFDFPTGAPVLYGAGAGSSEAFKISLSTPEKGIGFYVAPAQGTPSNGAFFVTAEFFGDTGGTSHLLGTDHTTGTIKTSCTTATCTFIGLDTAGNTGFLGITSVMVDVGSSSGGDQYKPAISTVFLQEAVPEPASLSVLGAGLLGLGALRRRKRNGAATDAWRWSPFGRWRVAGLRPDQSQS